MLFAAGCSVKTVITMPDGDIYCVQSKKDALVKLEKDNIKLEVNNQGKPGIFENLMGIMLMKTEVNLSNKDGIQ
jgi:hypothetical protein